MDGAGDEKKQRARPRADVFTWDEPERIARSLRRSVLKSTRRKCMPLQSAMSMLSFYVDRAGHSLPARLKKTLARAKLELRKIF